jgi:V8-like Glu-specific endopeptidase
MFSLQRLFLTFAALLSISAQHAFAEDQSAAAARLHEEIERMMDRFENEVDHDFEKKAIYGKDDRKDVNELGTKRDDETKEELELEEKAKSWAKSTCLVTDKDNLKLLPDGHYELLTIPYIVGEYHPCPKERFASQLRAGNCSAFLVAPDIVASAGHCFTDDDDAIKEVAFVFGYAIGASGKAPTKFSPDKVYFGQRVLVHANIKGGDDYGIVKLDRAVTAPGAKVLALNLDPKKDMKIGVIGHPVGLPTKVAFSTETKILDLKPRRFSSNLDAYGGNSGSAVLDWDGKVVGILVSGAKDFGLGQTSDGTLCFQSLTNKDAVGAEVATRCNVFVDKIKDGGDE